MKKGLLYLLIIGIGYSLFNSRCASTQQGPSGGPKDTIPPVLLQVSPPNGTLHFNGKHVDMVFNEYVKLKDASKNVIMSPPSLIRPQVRTRGKGIRVLFGDTLKRNTTYVINFGTAIEDNNEGNPFPSYRYVFSTGAYIDSMHVTGKVWDAYTLDPVENVSLMMYEEFKDSTIFQRIPDAYIRTDAWGYFSVDNIKNMPYGIVAIEDKNSNMRYDPGGEKVAFLDSLVHPVAMISHAADTLPPINPLDTAALAQRPYTLRFYIYAEEGTRQTLSEYTLLGDREIRLSFAQKNPQVNNFRLNGLDSTDYVLEKSRFSDTLTYWITAVNLPDTIRGTINYMRTDSSGGLSPTETVLRFAAKEKKDEPASDRRKNDEEPEIEYLKTEINHNVPHDLMERGVRFYFPTLPVNIDTTKLLLEKKSTDGKQFDKVQACWIKDPDKNRTYYLRAKWQISSDYRLSIQESAFTDVYGLFNDSTGIQFSTPNPDKFSSITLNLSNVGEQYIVQLLSEKKDKVFREDIITKDVKIAYNYLQAGKYCIRFIEDKNSNGIWDPGKYIEKRKPERVVFFTLTNDKVVVELPSNTEIEQSIDVGKIFEEFYK